MGIAAIGQTRFTITVDMNHLTKRRYEDGIH